MAMPFLHRFIVLLAVVAGIGVASAATVTTYSVVASTGTLSSDGDNWTASGLEYLAPGSNDGSNRSETGWYAGITRTWALSYTGSILKNYTGTKASDTKASFSDNAGRSIDEFSVRTILGADASPDGSGIKNEFQMGGLTQYMKTTEWNVWVTPEILHGLAQQNEDYVATLNIGGSTYTITVPRTSVLKDGDGVTWYPAVAVVDGKVPHRTGTAGIVERLEFVGVDPFQRLRRLQPGIVGADPGGDAVPASRRERDLAADRRGGGDPVSGVEKNAAGFGEFVEPHARGAFARGTAAAA